MLKEGNWEKINPEDIELKMKENNPKFKDPQSESVIKENPLEEETENLKWEKMNNPSAKGKGKFFSLN